MLRPIAVLAAIAAIPCAGGCGSAVEHSVRSSAYPRSSPEYELAKIDERGRTPRAGEIARYAAVLDQLQHGCTDSRAQLASWAIGIKSYLNGTDSELLLLRFALARVKRFGAQGAPRSTCRDVFVLVGADVNRYS